MTNNARSGLSNLNKQARNLLEDIPVAYVEFDAQGTIVYANSIARNLHCNKGEELVGKSAWDIVAGEQIELSRKAFMGIMQSGEEPPIIHRALYTQAGEYRIYEMFRTLIRDAQGRPTGLRYVYIDVTGARETREEEHLTHQYMKHVLESMSEVVIVIDSLGLIRLANQAAEEFTNRKAAEMFGRKIEECLLFIVCDMEDDDAFCVSAALSKPYAGTAIMLDSKQQAVSMEINTAPIVDHKYNYTMGVVITLRKPKSATDSIHMNVPN